MQALPNKEQREVISDFENNIILYASAGTGKTFTVANKVSAIIESGLAKPQEILCLTFTIKACGEMRDDVDSYSGGAKNVNVKTIHGFCLDLIKEEAKLSSDCYIEPAVYDEVDQEELLGRLFPELLTNRYLKEFLRNNEIADEVSKLFTHDVQYLPPYGFFWEAETKGRKVFINSRCKVFDKEQAERIIANTPAERIVCPVCKAGQHKKSNFCEGCGFDFRTYVQPAFAMKNCRGAVSTVKRFREHYGIYSGDEAKDFQNTCDKIKAENEKVYGSMFQSGRGSDAKSREIFAENAGLLVHGYNRIMRAGNALDFDDLIIEASRLLKNAEVLKRRQNSYKFIIVDEMQDTSEMEYSVLSRIFGESKILLCGDISQTIYEWRGSKPFKISENFRRNFNAKVYMLSENYRSTATLTNASFGYLKSVAPDVFGRYCPNELKVNSKNAGEPIRLVTLKNSRAEAAFVFKYLKQHPVADTSKICIMSRSNPYIANLYRGLQRINAELPEGERLNFFTVDKNYKFYKRPLVKNLLALFSLLLNKSDCANIERVAEKYIKGVGGATLSAIRNYGAVGVSASAFLEEDTYLHGDCFHTLAEAYAEDKLVIYDIETTGLDLCRDEIIQLAAVRIDKNGNVAKRFEKLVIPRIEIGEGALKTHGYSLEYIKEHGGVSPEEALREFSEFVKGCVLAGHNSSRFDRAVVDRQLRELDLPPIEIAEYDTLVLSKLFCPESENYKLETLCKKFGIVNERAHDAFEDVVATSKTLVYLLNNFIVPSGEQRVEVLNKYVKKFKTFFGQYKRMQSLFKEGDIDALLSFIFESYGFAADCEKEEDKIALDDFLRAVEGYKRTEADCERLLRTLLTDSALAGSQMDFLIKKLNKIPIITVHQSKGCEFDTVILVGADDCNFPSLGAARSGNGEEELRVFYVAISRAKQKLIITRHCELTPDFRPRGESPFLSHVPQQYIERYDFTDKY